MLISFSIPFFFRPKNGTHEALEEYKKAEKIGEEQGDCWSFYPECPISIFNVIPDVYTTDDQVEVSFDGFDSGSKFDASNDTSEVTHLLCFISKILEIFFNQKMKKTKQGHFLVQDLIFMQAIRSGILLPNLIDFGPNLCKS